MWSSSLTSWMVRVLLVRGPVSVWALPGTMRYNGKIAVLHRGFAMCGMFVAAQK